MKFWVYESTYLKQGTEKAFAVHDDHTHVYYIPRSQVKIVEKIEAETEYDVPSLIIEVPDWIIRRNNIPIYRLTELALER